MSPMSLTPPAEACGQKRKNNDLSTEVSEGEQVKKSKLEEETRQFSHLLATHLGSEEVVEQPHQMQ